MKKKPVTGMRDILPDEMEIRNYAIRLIRETYGSFGFLPLETPCVWSTLRICPVSRAGRTKS